jgi:hypothetical protein
MGAGLGVFLNITGTGMTLFLGNAVLSALLMYFMLCGNVPENIPSESYGKALVGKVVIGILFAMLSTSPATGPARLFAPLIDMLIALGPGYFVYSLVVDVFIATLLRRLEFYNAYKVIVFNLFYIPFITFTALLLAVREQNATLDRARQDLAYKKDGVVLGEAVQVVRLVSQPIQSPTQARMSPHFDIRPLPGRVKTYYKPENVSGRDFNPHTIIAGTSGSGKTTLVYHLIKDLSKTYPVVFIDVKGDISRALLKEKANAHIVHIASVGVNPFTKMGDETSNELVERLMDSISVVEPVGSRQEHLIREAAIAFCGRKEDGSEERPPSYPAIVSYLRGFVKTLPPPEVRWGMGGTGTRDALFSIYSKLEDLGRYFRDDGTSVPQVILRALKTPEGKRRKSDFPITVFNLEGISEKVRAIVLELILWNISNYMYHRGPLAFLRDKALVLVIDEAYLVTKPMQQDGKIGDKSRSILEEVARAGRSYGVALILATQRLSDVADGIRQNCQVWIVFNTASPEDTRILRDIGAKVMASVVSELKPGEAYIRAPNPRALNYYRTTTDTVAAIVGYIFRMERELLQVEEEGARRLLQKLEKKKKKDKRGRRLQVEEAALEEAGGDTGGGGGDEGGSSLLNYGVVCYGCMLLTSDPNYCPVCGQPPLLSRPKPAVKSKEEGGKQVSGTISSKPSTDHVECTEADVNGEWFLDMGESQQGEFSGEEIRKLAIEMFPEKKEELLRLSDIDILDFVG